MSDTKKKRRLAYDASFLAILAFVVSVGGTVLTFIIYKKIIGDNGFQTLMNNTDASIFNFSILLLEIFIVLGGIAVAIAGFIGFEGVKRIVDLQVSEEITRMDKK